MSVVNTQTEREDWMSPLNKLIWFKAFKRKATTVTIRDGRKFTLDYDMYPGKVWVNIDQASGQHHPCGIFDLVRVTNEMFLSEQTGKPYGQG